MQELIKLYEKSSEIKAIHTAIEKNKDLQIRGLVGSSESLVSGAVLQEIDSVNFFVVHDREEASTFYNDIKSIIGDTIESHIFPTSYKKPYQFEEVENANILQRAEVLNALNTRKEKTLIVITYPEALYEKVINKRSLVENTFSAKVGEQVDVEFLSDLLETYDFERTDFVYEPGQFAVRGGIIDVFSFAGDHPIRLELFGNEIESIREFDAESQLSREVLNSVNIIPNVQTKLLKEERQSIASYLPQDSIFWIKDYRNLVDVLDKGFNKAQESFDSILKTSGNTQVVFSPNDLFDDSESFLGLIEKFTKIEFGNRFYLSGCEEVKFDFKPQPTFHKNFNLLGEDLLQNSQLDRKNFIVAESYRQLERLEKIFEEINSEIEFTGINSSISEGFIDTIQGYACYTDHQIFDRFHRNSSTERFSKKKALTLKELKALKPGDYVVHQDYGIGRFAGLDVVDISGNQQEALRIVFKDDDLLYASIHSLHKVSKYSGKEGGPPSVSKLGSQEWENKKKRVKKKVKDIAKDLINLYAKRKAAPGFAFPEDNYLQAELESSFMYQDTPDQSKATSDVKADMELSHPMDRLVCGDVGFGKTEVAIRAAFKAVNSGKQVAVLVPTTILAMQHFQTFSKRLTDFPISIDYINRFRSSKDITRIKKEISEGKIDILIGTHRIVNKDLTFKELGLMVIDEEQKFGVKVKERLKEMRVNVDALTLTATPIPRTLHFSLMGARDLSIIATPPPNRRPVTTELCEYSEEILRDAISNEIRRGGQVFFVHNRVSDIEQVANTVLKLVPDAKVGIGHGQMEGSQLEKVMLKFIDGEYDVLVSTNIIESGLDIPNANTILINRAHTFGLSDLHQMRGRVGRSNTKAYCYLITPPTSVLSSDARKRLTTLEEFSDLGDGFKVAMRDLDIRGAGNLLGSEQSGFVNDMGFDMYHKILDEAVQELKETEFKTLFEKELLENGAQNIKKDCALETDLELLIPSDYVSNTSERLSLYNKLDNTKNEIDLSKFRNSLIDRFGQLPESVENLIESIKIRWAGIELGFEKIVIKGEQMKCYVPIENNDSYFQSEVFGGVLNYIKDNPADCKMKEHKSKMIIYIKKVSSVSATLAELSRMKAVFA